MIAETVCRAIARVRIKEAIRRQATIRPGETMFDGVECEACPVGFPFNDGEGVCPVEYGAGAAGVLSLDTIMRRVEALERWIDAELPTLKP